MLKKQPGCKIKCSLVRNGQYKKVVKSKGLGSPENGL